MTSSRLVPPPLGFFSEFLLRGDGALWYQRLQRNREESSSFLGEDFAPLYILVLLKLTEFSEQRNVFLCCPRKVTLLFFFFLTSSCSLITVGRNLITRPCNVPFSINSTNYTPSIPIKLHAISSRLSKPTYLQSTSQFRRGNLQALESLDQCHPVDGLSETTLSHKNPPSRDVLLSQCRPATPQSILTTHRLILPRCPPPPTASFLRLPWSPIE